MSGQKTQPENQNSRYVGIQLIELPKKTQPRRYFAPDKMKQLKASIEEHGILEPLIVRPLSEKKYELVAGERRLRAAKDLGLEEVPVIVRTFTDQQAYEVALLENLQRDDLNPIDETDGLLFLLGQVLEFKSKADVISLLNRAANAKKRDIELPEADVEQVKIVDEVFLKIGRLNRESFRTNRLPLLNLPEDVLVVLREGRLEYTKAKVIGRLEGLEQRQILMKEAIDRELSLSKIKERMREISGSQKSIYAERLQESIDRTPFTEDSVLKKEFKALLGSQAWNDASKEESLQKLLANLKEVLNS